MKLPRKIKILGQEFKILQMPQKKVAEKIGPNVFGAMNYSDKIIVISSDVSDEDKQLIFFHEVSHAISFVCGLNQVMSPELQEVMAESFANGLLEVMKQLAKAKKRRKNK